VSQSLNGGQVVFLPFTVSKISRELFYSENPDNGWLGLRRRRFTIKNNGCSLT
jgi:hypothetical protein